MLGSNTFTKTSEINVPLQFKDDLWIHPDDILIGDSDGGVVVPPSLVEQVVALCQERAEIDEKTFSALRAGEEMGPTITRFRKRKPDCQPNFLSTISFLGEAIVSINHNSAYYRVTAQLISALSETAISFKKRISKCLLTTSLLFS